MNLVYKNTGTLVTNEIWRECFCVVCKQLRTPGNIELVREIMEDVAGGEEYICCDCVSSGAADNLIKKYSLINK